MIKRSSAVIACVLVFVLTAVAVGAVSIAGTSLYFSLSASSRPQAQTPGGSTLSPILASGDYGVLDDIRNVIHNAALWDTDDEILIQNAARAMVYGERDRYAMFYTAEEYAQMRADNEGHYEGVGMRVMVDEDDGLVTVLHVYKSGPAYEAGVLKGDKIISVNGEVMPLNDVDTMRELVRGPAGTPVTLGIKRGSEMLELTMDRAAVVSENTEWRMLEGDVGYMHIIEFYGSAETLFAQGLEELTSQGMRGLILDLRDNPGGDKDVVCNIADLLLPEGPIITMTDKNGNIIDEVYSDEAMLGLPIVVLINENTASASELLSGNIQDYGVGRIVGKTSFGKGVGQTYAQLSDGAVMAYTAFEYLTGGGRCPQDVGIVPDIEVDMPEDIYTQQFLWATESDPQFSAALDELKTMME